VPVHPAAQAGFARGSAAYARGRPSYPAEVVAHLRGPLGLSGSSRVLELGAGTGKFTRVLLEGGLAPVAMEPVAAMRAEFRRSLPRTPLLAGVAEALPLREGSLEAVVAAQCFHWFDAPRPAANHSVAELDRCLRPNGPVALLWNVRDDSVPWQSELTRLLERYRPRGVPSYRTGAWRAGFERSGRFEPIRRAEWAHEHEGTLAVLLDRVLSVSYISQLPEEERSRLVDEVRELAVRRGLDGAEPIRMRYRSELYTTRRLA
jgi:SAM-dependent methyltransferase